MCCKYQPRADTTTHEHPTQRGVTWMFALHLNSIQFLSDFKATHLCWQKYMFAQILVYVHTNISDL